MTKRIVSLAMFLIMFIASLGGGIYANVQAAHERALYNEQIHYADKYQKLYDKAQKSDNPIIGSQYFKNLYQEKTENAQKEAISIKLVMRKYFAFTAVLYFVSLAMLICSIVTGLPLSKMKKESAEEDESDEAKPVMKAKRKPENQEPVKKERPKSDFDLILEAPKPSIREDNDNQ